MNLYVKKTGWGRGSSLLSLAPLPWQRFLMQLLVWLGVMLCLNLFGDSVRNSFYAMTAPVSEVLLAASNQSSNFFSSWFNAGTFREKAITLEQENQALRLAIANLKETAIQSNLLQENSLRKNFFAAVMARVVGVDSTRDLIILDRGSSDGIAKDMPVISSANVLYGRVKQVYENFSQVQLLSNSESVVDVKIQGSQEGQMPVYGAVRGLGSLSLYLDLVAADARISFGDTVTSSALEGIFPPDLLVGTITSQNQSDTKPFQTAGLQPSFNIKNLDSLFIITNYKKQ